MTILLLCITNINVYANYNLDPGDGGGSNPRIDVEITFKEMKLRHGTETAEDIFFKSYSPNYGGIQTSYVVEDLISTDPTSYQQLNHTDWSGYFSVHYIGLSALTVNTIYLEVWDWDQYSNDDLLFKAALTINSGYKLSQEFNGGQSPTTYG